MRGPLAERRRSAGQLGPLSRQPPRLPLPLSPQGFGGSCSGGRVCPLSASQRRPRQERHAPASSLSCTTATPASSADPTPVSKHEPIGADPLSDSSSCTVCEGEPSPANSVAESEAPAQPALLAILDMPHVCGTAPVPKSAMAAPPADDHPEVPSVTILVHLSAQGGPLRVSDASTRGAYFDKWRPAEASACSVGHLSSCARAYQLPPAALAGRHP